MSANESPQRYDWTRSYQWNYDHAPPLPNRFSSPTTDQRTLHFCCGLAVRSPLGIAAGPLLNGRWVLHYAALGFDLLTYKTVRSRNWPCYELPNLQPVEHAESPITESEEPLRACPGMTGSWAVSFGMPSQPPAVWRRDVEETRKRLPAGKLLSVSVVATPTAEWTIDDLADDYATCAAWAVDSGADLVELNFSCPNVATCDGQLYQHPEDASHVAQRVRQRIGQTPMLIKIGHVNEPILARRIVAGLTSSATALVMVNCLSKQVRSGARLLFSGQKRGIAGSLIREAALRQLELFREVITAENSPLETIGVGGVGTRQDVEAVLGAGARGVQIATAAMIDPILAIRLAGAA